MWSYYYEDGNLLSEIRYRPDEERDRHLVVTAIGFNKNGTRNEFEIKTGFFNSGGQRMGYSLDAKRKITTNYENGLIHGERIDCYISGNNALKGQYSYGNKCGEWIGWDEEGNEVIRQNFS